MMCMVWFEQLKNKNSKWRKVSSFQKSSLGYTEVKEGTHLEGFWEQGSLNLPHQKCLQLTKEPGERDTPNKPRFGFLSHKIFSSCHDGVFSLCDARLGFHH